MTFPKISFSKRVKKTFVACAAAALFTFAVIFFSDTNIAVFQPIVAGIQKIENMFYDSYFKFVSLQDEDNVSREGSNVSVSEYADQNIFIVDIDEYSLNKLGQYNSWSRDIHANVVQALDDGGASAILFDILFKTADFGKTRTQNTLRALKHAAPQSDWDSLAPALQSLFNDDSLLVQAVQESKNVIVCDLLDNTSAYQHQSQWEPLSTPAWQEAIGLKSTMAESQADSAHQLEIKDLIDNLFPELAHAGAEIGFVNVFPDNDGVMRKISLLQRFPNPDLYPDANVRIYPALTLAAAFHLFGVSADSVQIKIGKHIDLGKPFGIYRDSCGNFNTTYPQFSYPMFEALLTSIQKHKDLEQNEKQQSFIQVATKVIVHHQEDGLALELFEGQMLSPEFSDVLLSLIDKNISLSDLEEPYSISENVTLQKSEDTPNTFVLTDDENEEEAIFTPYTLSVLRFFKDSIPNIALNKTVHLSCDLDISYNVSKKEWQSNFIILSDAVLRSIQKADLKDIQNLKPGQITRFGEKILIPIDKNGQFRITYGSRYNTEKSKRNFTHLSYYDVAKKRLDPGLYEGKIFILGSAAPALFDFVSAPHEENYPGVLVQASLIENMLRGKFLVYLDLDKQMMILFFLAALCVLILLSVRNFFISFSLLFAIFISYVFVGSFAFQDGLYLGFAKPLLILILNAFGMVLIRMYFETRDKQFLNDAFKQYISPDLIQEMLDNEIKPTLGGTESELTAYFTDIAGFSTFSEKIGNPSKLVELLNEYLSVMTDTLTANRGTLDKYEGDAIIAFFGAPMPLKNHAQNACETAISMQDRLMDLRKKWSSEGDKWPQTVKEMHMRIGINSGTIVTGNMGSLMRKNYTMMGDNVNLAARLESAAKQYGAYIQISENTRKLLEPDTLIYRSLDYVRVVGKSEPVHTYELLCKNDNSAKAEQMKEFVKLWETGIQAYLSMQFDEAISIFEKTLALEPHLPERDPGAKTTPSEVYIKRCEAYKINPPVKENETWDGVFTATSK